MYDLVHKARERLENKSGLSSNISADASIFTSKERIYHASSSSESRKQRNEECFCGRSICVVAADKKGDGNESREMDMHFSDRTDRRDWHAWGHSHMTSIMRGRGVSPKEQDSTDRLCDHGSGLES